MCTSASATVTFTPATSWRDSGSSTSTPTTGDASISCAPESTGPVATGAATTPWWAHSGGWGLSCKLYASQMNIKRLIFKYQCPLWAYLNKSMQHANTSLNYGNTHWPSSTSVSCLVNIFNWSQPAAAQWSVSLSSTYPNKPNLFSMLALCHGYPRSLHAGFWHSCQ